MIGKALTGLDIPVGNLSGALLRSDLLLVKALDVAALDMVIPRFREGVNDAALVNGIWGCFDDELEALLLMLPFLVLNLISEDVGLFATSLSLLSLELLLLLLTPSGALSSGSNPGMEL